MTSRPRGHKQIETEIQITQIHDTAERRYTCQRHPADMSKNKLFDVLPYYIYRVEFFICSLFVMLMLLLFLKSMECYQTHTHNRNMCVMYVCIVRTGMMCIRTLMYVYL